jgi:alkylation response protein AidB-like acyl-CoA dehydrogenase
MDFRLGERSDAFRAEARAFLADVVTEEMRDELHRTGASHHEEFHRALVDRGWLAPGWPEELGGQGRDPMEMLAFAEEFQQAGAPT